MRQEAALISNSPITRGRVLLADDSNNERAALAEYLRRLGYEIIEASNGQATVDQLQNNEIDALLLDLHMPSGDGFDVLAYLQKHRRALPVILLTGMDVDDIQREIHGLPEQSLPLLMLKPIDLDQLAQILEMKLSGELPSVSLEKKR